MQVMFASQADILLKSHHQLNSLATMNEVLSHFPQKSSTLVVIVSTTTMLCNASPHWAQHRQLPILLGFYLSQPQRQHFCWIKLLMLLAVFRNMVSGQLANNQLGSTKNPGWTKLRCVFQNQLWSQVSSLPKQLNGICGHSWLIMLLENAPRVIS